MDSKINKHSSGPWYPGHLGNDSTSCDCHHIVNEGYAGAIAIIGLDNGIKSIADGANDCPPLEEAIANMHLIAASPDLLDTVDMVYDLLENLTGFYEDREDDAFWETIAVLRTNLKWVRKKARNELKK